MKRFLSGLVALGLLVGATEQANADYIFTTIDVPGSTFTTAAGINNLGQIVGNSSLGRSRCQEQFLTPVLPPDTCAPPGARRWA